MLKIVIRPIPTSPRSHTNPNWLFSGIGTLEDGRKVMHQILELKDRPDAVIAGSDEVAAGMNGIRVRCKIQSD